MFHVFRAARIFFSLFTGGYWINTFQFQLNSKFNEYGRPLSNVRLNISGSVNSTNADDSNKYFFMNLFYSEQGNSFQYHTTHSYGSWSFERIGTVIQIIVTTTSAFDYLNINI